LEVRIGRRRIANGTLRPRTRYNGVGVIMA
jgi:hypothetical protein